MSRVSLGDCVIEASHWKTRWLRRERWTVTVDHLPSGIIGHGLGARSYEEARDSAVTRIESLMRVGTDRP